MFSTFHHFFQHREWIPTNAPLRTSDTETVALKLMALCLSRLVLRRPEDRGRFLEPQNSGIFMERYGTIKKLSVVPDSFFQDQWVGFELEQLGITVRFSY